MLDGQGIPGACKAGDPVTGFFRANPLVGYNPSQLGAIIGNTTRLYNHLADVQGISVYDLDPKIMDDVLAFQNALYPGEVRDHDPAGTWRVDVSQTQRLPAGEFHWRQPLPLRRQRRREADQDKPEHRTAQRQPGSRGLLRQPARRRHRTNQTDLHRCAAGGQPVRRPERKAQAAHGLFQEHAVARSRPVGRRPDAELRVHCGPAVCVRGVWRTAGRQPEARSLALAELRPVARVLHRPLQHAQHRGLLRRCGELHRPGWHHALRPARPGRRGAQPLRGHQRPEPGQRQITAWHRDRLEAGLRLPAWHAAQHRR